MYMKMGGINGMDEYTKTIAYLFPFPVAEPVVVGRSPFARQIASLFPPCVSFDPRREKLFDVLAEGLLSRNNRDDETAIERFIAGVRGWKTGCSELSLNRSP
jgi:hypothetical protein